jgi:hypothetical protein
LYLSGDQPLISLGSDFFLILGQSIHGRFLLDKMAAIITPMFVLIHVGYIAPTGQA